MRFVKYYAVNAAVSLSKWSFDILQHHCISLPSHSLICSLEDASRVFYLGGVDPHDGRDRRTTYELIGTSHWRKLAKPLPVAIGDSRTFFPIGMDYCNGTTSFYGIPPLTLRDMIGVGKNEHDVG